MSVTTAIDSLARPNGNGKTKNGSVSWQRGLAGVFIHPMRGSCTVAWGCQSSTSVIGLDACATAQAVGLIEWATNSLRTATQSAGKSVAERGRVRSTTTIEAECQPDERAGPRC